MIKIFGIILFCVSIIGIFYNLYQVFQSKKNAKKFNDTILQSTEKKIENLLKQEKLLTEEIKGLNQARDTLIQLINDKQKNYNTIIIQKDNLELKINSLQEEIDNKQKEFSDIQAALLIGLEEKRKQNLHEDKSAFQLVLTDNEKSDIAKLKDLRLTFSQPRAISKLIWSTYYQTKLTQLCNKVIGAGKKSGIYKLTNTQTDEVYIGQAVDISERWKQHAKCGCGIDTPANNKLYISMNKYGLENFLWEIVEECSSADLNEKETRYIELFRSVEYGLNTLKGKTKK